MKKKIKLLIREYELYIKYYEPLATKNRDLWELDKIKMAKEFIQSLKAIIGGE